MGAGLAPGEAAAREGSAQVPPSPSGDMGLISRATAGAQSWQQPQAGDALPLAQAPGGLEYGTP